MVLTLPKIFGTWIFIKLVDMVSFLTNISSKVKKKNCQFVSHLQAIRLNNTDATYCFIKCGDHVFNYQEGFSWISPKLHFTHKTFYMTQLLVLYLHMFENSQWRGWGYGSEQVPLIFGTLVKAKETRSPVLV